MGKGRVRRVGESEVGRTQAAWVRVGCGWAVWQAEAIGGLCSEWLKAGRVGGFGWLARSLVVVRW